MSTLIPVSRYLIISIHLKMEPAFSDFIFRFPGQISQPCGGRRSNVLVHCASSLMCSQRSSTPLVSTTRISVAIQSVGKELHEYTCMRLLLVRSWTARITIQRAAFEARSAIPPVMHLLVCGLSHVVLLCVALLFVRAHSYSGNAYSLGYSCSPQE